FGANPAPGIPTYHQGQCSNPGSIMGQAGASHAVAVDYHTNQVLVAVPNDAIIPRQGGAQVVGSFGGWQPAGSGESMFPIDPQYPPSSKGIGSDCTPAVPCVGMQAVPTQKNSFTSLCPPGPPAPAATATDSNGCTL